jgi:hypothetical protein
MQDTLTRIFENLVGRVTGPMHFRVFLQPTMAIIFAIRDGRKDAREGKVPYFWSLFTEPGHRMDLLRRGWKSVGKVFILAMILDAVYQIWQLKWFYPGEAVLVALILAIVPYVLLRGPVNRLFARRAIGGGTPCPKIPVAKQP